MRTFRLDDSYSLFYILILFIYSLILFIYFTGFYFYWMI